MWWGGGSYPRDCGLGSDWCSRGHRRWGEPKSGIKFKDKEVVLVGYINSFPKVVNGEVRM